MHNIRGREGGRTGSEREVRGCEGEEPGEERWRFGADIGTNRKLREKGVGERDGVGEHKGMMWRGRLGEGGKRGETERSRVERDSEKGAVDVDPTTTMAE